MTPQRPSTANASEHLALDAVLDGQEDDARDVLAGMLPAELSTLATAAHRLGELAECVARGRR